MYFLEYSRNVSRDFQILSKLLAIHLDNVEEPWEELHSLTTGERLTVLIDLYHGSYMAGSLDLALDGEKF